MEDRGIIIGYEHGRFDGDRALTRYEYAAMIYRAIQQGVKIDPRVAREFAHELDRYTVDRIHGEDDDQDKVERVRVIREDERDHYGSVVQDYR